MKQRFASALIVTDQDRDRRACVSPLVRYEDPDRAATALITI